jgi:hypothetical protein
MTIFNKKEKFLYMLISHLNMKNMKKKAPYWAVIIIILLGIFVIVKFGPSITSAAIGVKLCVSPEAALEYINEKGCERVYEDPTCESQNKVEIRCPETQATVQESDCKKNADKVKKECDSICDEREHICRANAKAAKESCNIECNKDGACKKTCDKNEEIARKACEEEHKSCKNACEEDKKAAKEACED